MCFFRKRKKRKEAKIKTSDKLIIERLETDEDDYILKLVNQMIEGNPLILNFDLLHIDHANKVLAFITGVVYAINGHYQFINDNIYLFGNKDLYTDNSIKNWIEENIN